MISVVPKFTWTIENFSGLKCRRLYSDAFTVGNSLWRLLIFPKGNNGVDHLSFYLDVADWSKLPADWTRYADFCLEVVNKDDNHATIRKYTKKLFYGKDTDWGFTSFIPLTELHDPVKGFLKNDILIVQVEFVTTNNDNSKNETIHVGHEKVVYFRALEKPNEDVFSLQLWSLLRFDEVVQRVAHHLCIHDPSKIRLTSHNGDSGGPAACHIENRDMDVLQEMLDESSKDLNIFYYEVRNISTRGPVKSMMSSSCAICLIEQKEGVCVPCGHVAACMSCLNNIQNKAFGCPISRLKIQQVIRIFVA